MNNNTEDFARRICDAYYRLVISERVITNSTIRVMEDLAMILKPIYARMQKERLVIKDDKITSK